MAARSPSPSPASGGRLLLGELRPERRALVGLGAILSVAVGLPVVAQLLLGAFVDDAASGASASRLTTVALAFGLLLLVADGLRLLVTYLAVRLAWRIGNRLRVDLCRHALELDLTWHGDHSAGQVIERVDGDVDAVTRFTGTAVLEVIGNIAVVAAVAATALWVEWRAGLILLATVAVATVVLVRLRSVAVPAHDHEREVLSHLYGDVEDRLGGLEDLRANGAGAWAVDRLHRHSARWWRAARDASARGEGAYAATGVTFALGTVATLAVSAWLTAQGRLTLGAVLVLFRFVQMVQTPLERIGEQLNEFQKAVAGIRRAARLLGTPVTLAPGTRPLPPGPLSVEVDHASLAYGEHLALDDVVLRLEPGRSIGVVGRTGSGKTSLGRLLARFWDPTDGAVRLGGVDLRDADPASLRRRVAVVTQEVEVLRASVADNLTLFGTVDAPEEALADALGRVGLGPWLDALPDGLATEIDGSSELSGGEAQLLAFARVLLADPGLVVLDEATSRLDPATEARVAAATRTLREGRTLVIVAHRLDALDEVDEICVVDGGRIVEHGPRARLAGDPGSRFAQLRAAQAAATTGAGR